MAAGRSGAPPMRRVENPSSGWRTVAAALTLIVAIALGALCLEPSSRASTTSEDLILLHGFSGAKPNGSADTVPGGCGGAFGTNSTADGSLASYFRQRGWTGALRTVGFYTGDWKGADSCDFQLDSKFGQMSASVCSTVYANGATEGTNNQDLRNIGCRFAWYIFQNYTAKNHNVRIAAHSMGGLIAHWAIFGVQHHLAGYPSYLYVSQVVTFDTPHGGIPSIATLGCGNCRMAYNMAPDADDNPADGAPSAFINTLLSEVYAPMGSPGVPTEWTLMGSQSEGWLSGSIPVRSSLAFPPAWPG